jgi:hypothetical protein
MPALNFNGAANFVVAFPKFKNVFFDSCLSYEYLQLNASLLKELRALRGKYSSDSTAFIVLKKPNKDKVVVVQISLALFSGLQSKLIASAIFNVDADNVAAFVHHYCESTTGLGKLALDMSRLKKLGEMYNSQDGYYTTHQKYILSGHQNKN